MPLPSSQVGDRETLAALLLHPSLPDHTALFPNATTLAAEIASLSDTPYTDRQQSVAALLGQVFHGRRGCPQPLRDAIIRVVRNRVHALSDVPTAVSLQRIEEAIDQLNQGRKRQAVSRPRTRFSPDLERTANRFVIISFFSAIKATQTGKQVVARMADLMRLRTPQEQPSVRYTLCVPTARDAVDYWRALFEELTTPSEPEHTQALTAREAATVLQARDDANDICLFELPYMLCLTTIVLYNPENEDIVGFALYYQENGAITSTEMPERYLAAWQRFYGDFLVGAISQQRVHFRSCRDLFYRGR